MVTIIISVLVGFVVGVLVGRNNKVLVEKTVNAAKKLKK